MKRIFKFLFLLIILFLLTLFLIGFYYHQPLPNVHPNPKADQIGERMLRAINKVKFDSLQHISWIYNRSNHRIAWDRKNEIVKVIWDNYEVEYSIVTMEGKVYADGIELLGNEKTELIGRAKKIFINDSFWLVAPFKIFDQGTIRSLVELDEGYGLLVTYQSGGVTPGDSYLWILDKNYMPVAWKMWVSIIPIGGLKITWENFIYHKGVPFSTMHRGPFSIELPITILSIQ